jgi:hypothetical protein
LIDSRVETLTVVAGGGTLVGVVVTEGIVCEAGALTIFHSFVSKTNGAVLDLSDELVDGRLFTTTCALQMQNSAVRSSGGQARAVVVGTEATIDLRANLIDISTQQLVNDTLFDDFVCDVDDGCLGFADNIEGRLLTAPANDFLLDSGTPNDAVDAGRDPTRSPEGTSLAPFIVPGSIVRDHDGDCRFRDGDPPDIGPDEAG